MLKWHVFHNIVTSAWMNFEAGTGCRTQRPATAMIKFFHISRALLAGPPAGGLLAVRKI